MSSVIRLIQYYIINALFEIERASTTHLANLLRGTPRNPAEEIQPNGESNGEENAAIKSKLDEYFLMYHRTFH
jgi:hypothetical protein